MQPLPEKEAPPALFLGVCHHALSRLEGLQWDFFRFGRDLFLSFLPQKLTGPQMVIGMTRDLLVSGASVRFLVRDSRHRTTTAQTDLTGRAEEELSGTISISRVPQRLGSEFGVRLLRPKCSETVTQEATQYHVLPVPCPPLFVIEPTTVLVSMVLDDEELPLGTFDCRFAKPRELTQAEIMAIKSRPDALSTLCVVIRCRKCDESVLLYTCLDPAQPEEHVPEGGVRLEDVPDQWRCNCGATDVPTTYLKQGIRALFRQAKGAGTFDLNFTPLYEPGALDAIFAAYQQLINGTPSEEQVQVFLEENPVLWHFLGPSKIIPKPPLLANNKADFGILTSSRILYFVEIEKPQTKLVRSRGGVHSELQAGLNQIRDWRLTVEDHRQAVLDQLELKSDSVHDIRYLLVAGLAHLVKPKHIESLRRTSFGEDVSLFTFDDLASILRSTILELRCL